MKTALKNTLLLVGLVTLISSCKKENTTTKPGNSGQAANLVTIQVSITLVEYNNSMYASHTFSSNVRAEFTYISGATSAPQENMGSFNLTNFNPPVSSTTVTTTPCYYQFTTNTVTLSMPSGSTYNLTIFDNNTPIAKFMGSQDNISYSQSYDLNTTVLTCNSCCAKPFLVHVMR